MIADSNSYNSKDIKAQTKKVKDYLLVCKF